MNFQSRLFQTLNKNSDKVSKHGYHEIYGNSLPENINALIEIGISIDGTNRSSLNSWSELYPDAKIIGLDNVESKLINSGNITSYLVDQSNSNELKNFVNTLEIEPDVIIDDGSHNVEHFLLTFSILFPILKKSGVYFIEDVWSGEVLERSKNFFDEQKEIICLYHDRTHTNQPDSIIIEIRKK